MSIFAPQIERSKLLRLEALRGAAALYVMLGHLIVGRLEVKHGLLSYVFRFGQEAVMLFFLLSGFVIYYSFSIGKDKSFKGYFQRRWLRIYPIFILALFLSWGLAGAKAGSGMGMTLLGNLFMLQDFSYGKPGVWVDTFCGDSPLWSLSYEWWFYMMFYPLYQFVAPDKRQWLALVVAIAGLLVGFVWPDQIARFALYFIIWWSGAEMARTYLAGRPVTFGSQKTSLVAIALLTTALLISVFVWKQTGHALSWGMHPFLEARHFAAALFLMAGGILWAGWKWRCFDWTLGWFVWLAPISYGIYVLHFPIIMNSGWLPVDWSLSMQVVLAVAVALFAAFVAEIYLQPFVKRWLSPVVRSDRMG